VLKVWDLATEAVAWSSDGRLLAGCRADGCVVVWDGAMGKPEREWAIGSAVATAVLTFRPDGRELAVALPDDGETVQRWDAATGERLPGWKGPAAVTEGLAFSADGRSLAAAGKDGSVRVWGAAGEGPARTLTSHTGSVMAVAYSADGRRLAAADFNGNVRLWDPATGQEALTLRHPCATGVAFCRGDRLLVAGGNGGLRVWDATPPDDVGR
jgi:WD40 repeat protein